MIEVMALRLLAVKCVRYTPWTLSAKTYERALVFLLLRLRRLTRFFLHFALIVEHYNYTSAGYNEVG